MKRIHSFGSFILESQIPEFHSFNRPIYKKQDIKEYVAPALLKACEIFWDKNIRTTGSWVPSQQDPGGRTIENYIDIQFTSLSEKNKEIALGLGEMTGYAGDYWMLEQGRVPETYLQLKILDRHSSPEDIEKKSVEIANQFEQQALLWYSPVTLDQKIEEYEDMKAHYPSDAIPDIDRAINWTKENWGEDLSGDQYFDEHTRTIWASKELYVKSKIK